MRIRPHCVVFSFLLVLTLASWYMISSVAKTPGPRAWATPNKQTRDHTKLHETLEGTIQVEAHDSSLRIFKNKLYQTFIGTGNSDDYKSVIKVKNNTAFKDTNHPKLGPPKKMNSGMIREDLTGRDRPLQHGGLDISRNIPEFNVATIKKRGPSVLKDKGVKHDKWIVLTTVAKPTSDVKFLANITGWKVVVVGDTKTPQNWSYPNCIYLGVTKQLQLGLITPRHLPYKHYARKNVGYLYAIAHGAEVIYETDDDNRPLDTLHSFVQKPTMSGLMFADSSHTFNPYRHFGQPTLWPRGFPFSQIGSEQRDVYRLSDKWPSPAVQQGVVNGDPDMDAVFRLTRKVTLKPLEVTFDPAAPPAILPPGVFSPFNSQNTLFLKKALWALLIPTTTTFRICDIWRGYWAQRLLWEIGEHLAFFPPNAYQQRNAHNYMADMENEEGMYFNTDRLLSFLSNWTCPEIFSFFQCVYKLSLNMAIEGFWLEADVAITKYWLEDLIRIGYPEPKRYNSTSIYHRMYEAKKKPSKNSKPKPLDIPVVATSVLEKKKAVVLLQGTYVQFVPSDQASPEICPKQVHDVSKLIRQADLVARLCAGLPSLFIPTLPIHTQLKNVFEDILLIVVFNWPHYSNTLLTEIFYRPIFPNIIYCGANATQFDTDTASISNRGLSFVEAPRIQGGHFAPWCTVKAMQMNYKVSGYLVTGDDVVLNVWNFRKFDKSKTWIYDQRYFFNTTSNTYWHWWSTFMGSPAYSSAILSLTLLANMDVQKDNVYNIKVVETKNHLATDNHTVINSKIKKENVTSSGEGKINKKAKNKLDIKDLIPDNITRPSHFLTKLYTNTGGPSMAVHTISDTYYIPSRMREDVIFYMTHFLAHNTFVELCVPTVLHGLELNQNFEFFNGTNLWMEQRKNAWARYDAQNHFLHPVKFSDEANLGLMCTSYLPLLLAHGHGES